MRLPRTRCPTTCTLLPGRSYRPASGIWLASFVVQIPPHREGAEGDRQILPPIHRANAKLHLSVLLKAVNDLREAGHAASARAELGTDIPSERQYAIVEKNYFDLDVEDDLDDARPDLSELRIAHDPTVVGIDAFRHLGTSRRSAQAAAEAEEVIRPEESGFAGIGGGDLSGDDLDFEY